MGLLVCNKILEKYPDDNHLENHEQINFLSRKMNLEEIISDVAKFYETSLDKFLLERRASLADRIEYMGKRKLEKLGLCRIIWVFFNALYHFFQGKGFISTPAMAFELARKLRPIRTDEIKPQQPGEDTTAYRLRVFQENRYACHHKEYVFVEASSCEWYVKIGDEPTLRETKPFGNVADEKLGYPDKPKVVFSEVDALEQLIFLKKSDRIAHVALVNFADRNNIGGGVKNGAVTKEATLCLRTNLFDHLSKQPQWYPLPENGGVYSPYVAIFRDSKLAFMEESPQADILSMAAFTLKAPCTQADLEKTKEMIRNMFRLGNSILVIEDLGFESRGNNPTLVASCFAEVLKERNWLDRLYFAFSAKTVKEKTDWELFSSGLQF